MSSQSSAAADLTTGDLRRFFIEVPRYTSYPTAADFTDAVGPDDHAANLRRAGQATDTGLSLYVHLPFCKAICHFCGCHALVARTDSRIQRYLAALGTEMRLVAAELGGGRAVTELHFGGGSPSLLAADDFERVMADLRSSFALAPDASIAIEADPRTVDRDKLQRYRRLGVERVSFGFQDLDEGVQRAIGRNQTAAVSRAAHELAREAGFAGINVDLCYGLPEQSEETFARTVDEVVALAPDRVALFGYAHVPWLKPRQKLIVASTLPGPDLRLRLMAAARARLTDAGYVAIGLDHFALPGDPLATAAAAGLLHRNFQGYTTTRTDSLVGLGLSGVSDLPAGYAQNLRALPDYYRALDAGRLPTERGASRSEDDRVRGEIIRRLMCRFELDVAAVERDLGVDFAVQFGPELAELTRLAADGLVSVEPARVRLTDLGRVFVRNVAAVFDAYWRRRATDARPRFSSSA